MTCVRAIRKAFIYGVLGMIFSILLLIAIEAVFQPEDPGDVIFESPILNWFVENEVIIVIASSSIAAIVGLFSIFEKKNDLPPT